ncbi:uncharacterized protein DUF2490 [Flavobacteriaceae bacterium MAR_2009_75]|nr:uncharacterized protein DUF2490 [Flavobacteriaceae bacterium MAR_2009_75]
MYFIKKCVVILFFLLACATHGQDNFTFYIEPAISLNYDVATNYTHNFEIANRNYIYDEDVALSVRQLEIAHFSKLEIGFDQSIAFGIKYRFREAFESDEENELRLTQQYNFTKRDGNARIGNRIRLEQRIRPSITIHRLRYRLAFDTPLNGEQLDVGEAYFVVSTEALLSLAKASKPEFDQRFTSQIGWLLNPETKLQTGIEYRFENYGQKTENVLFLLVGLVFSM